MPLHVGHLTWLGGHPLLLLVWSCALHALEKQLGPREQAVTNSRILLSPQEQQDDQHEFHTLPAQIFYRPPSVSHIFPFSKDYEITKNKHKFIEEIFTEYFNTFISPVQFNYSELISNLQEKGMKQILRPGSLVSSQRIRNVLVS